MKPFHAVLATGALLTSSTVLTPQPALAYPTCEQEISIRCHGYSVGNHERLDIYYDSYEQCVQAETAAQCPTRPYAGLTTRAQDVVDRVALRQPA